MDIGIAWDKQTIMIPVPFMMLKSLKCLCFCIIFITKYKYEFIGSTNFKKLICAP